MNVRAAQTEEWSGHSQYGGHRVWSLSLITAYNTPPSNTLSLYSHFLQYNSLQANWIFPQQSVTLGGDATAIFNFIAGSQRLLKSYLKMAAIIMTGKLGKPRS